LTNASFKGILRVHPKVDCTVGYVRRKIRTMVARGERLHEYLELILKHWTHFIQLITAYLLTPNMVSISSSSGDLKI